MESGWLKAVPAALGALLIGLFGLAPSASAADTLFWTDLDSGKIMKMPLDGSSPGVALDTTPAQVIPDEQYNQPGSLDYDPDTGRLYWPNAGDTGNISWAAADGSGGAVLANVTPPVQPPLGLSLDSGTDTLYLLGGNGQSIATMSLDGTQGTWALNDDDFRSGPLVDAQGGTLWVGGPEWVSWGNLDGSGSLDTYMPSSFMGGGFSVDRDADRLYGTWYPGPGEGTELAWMATDASADGSLQPTAVDVIGASSTAIDHDTGEIYWTNAIPYGELEDTRGIFKVSLGGGAGSQVGSEQIGGRSGGLIILKTPQATSDPVLTGETELGSELTCGDVSWAGDRPEAHYFRSPTDRSISWTRDGQPLLGAEAETITAEVAGTYRCQRNGENAAGNASAESNPIVVTGPEPPICPTIKLSVEVSKFSPPKPFGNVNAPGVRVTLRSGQSLVVSLKPKITFKGKEGSRVGQLRKHEIRVNGRKRLRFLLPGVLTKAIAKERGEVRFAPVTFAARATIWQPGNKKCAQKQDLKLRTKVKYVSKKPGIGLRRR